MEQTEDDALTYSLNIENSVEKLTWLDEAKISCITQSNDLQLWNAETGDLIKSYNRDKICRSIKVILYNQVLHGKKTLVTIVCRPYFKYLIGIQFYLYVFREVKKTIATLQTHTCLWTTLLSCQLDRMKAMGKVEQKLFIILNNCTSIIKTGSDMSYL